MSPEWLALLLRFLLILGIYLFLLQVVLVIRRDLVATRPGGRADAGTAAVARLVTIDPAASGLQPGQALTMAGVNAVGRSPANAIQIDDDFVSARHAVITQRGGDWWIEDLGSTNGTFVNGRRVDSPVRIRPGDEVGIGRVRLRIEAGR